jgi:hypothetical protein
MKKAAFKVHAQITHLLAHWVWSLPVSQLQARPSNTVRVQAQQVFITQLRLGISRGTEVPHAPFICLANPVMLTEAWP